MFGIGMPELILIFIIALIVLGPKKLPEIAKSLGRATREFRKASQDFKQAMGLDDENEPPAVKPANNSSAEIHEDCEAALAHAPAPKPSNSSEITDSQKAGEKNA